MTKTIAVDHAVLTLALSPAALGTGGMDKKTVDELVTKRLSEGWDDVETIPLRTNFDERQQPTHVVNLYIFKKYASEKPQAQEKATKKSDA